MGYYTKVGTCKICGGDLIMNTYYNLPPDVERVFCINGCSRDCKQNTDCGDGA